MPEIKPDLSDKSRCISVHWSLPVQCVLPAAHRENNHEAWHPETGNRMRYRRTMGTYRTEDLHHGEWHDLKIPPPGGYCCDVFKGVRCQQQYGHPLSWQHRAVVDGCTHSWNTAHAKKLTVTQLDWDVQQLRGMVYETSAELVALRRVVAELLHDAATSPDSDAAAVIERFGEGLPDTLHGEPVLSLAHELMVAEMESGRTDYEAAKGGAS